MKRQLGNLVKSVLCFHQVSSGNHTQVYQTCMSNMSTWSAISPFHKLQFFFKTWLIVRSLSKLVRSFCSILILATLLEHILARLDPILAVPQLSVHSQVEAPCWQGLCCHLPPSVSLSLGYPTPWRRSIFFIFIFLMNDSTNSSQSMVPENTSACFEFCAWEYLTNIFQI